MINKTYKIINNKFPRFFKFVFFLRYLFAVFFISCALFLFIPNFFDYEKREKNIKFFLANDYNIDIKRIKNIKFNSFPLPHLEADQVISGIYHKNINLNSQKIKIYPKLTSIYNYNNFKVRKLIFKNSKINLNLDNLNILLKNTFNLKKNITFLNLNISVVDEKKSILDLNKINYSNFGYKKNKIEGEIFDKKFQINIKDDLTKLNFNLVNSGVFLAVNSFKNDKKKELIGSLKGKILNSNLQFDYTYNSKSVELEKLFFRNKFVSFDSEAQILFKPFFKLITFSEIKEFNPKLIQNLDITKLLKFDDAFKKMNSQNNFKFRSKKFSRVLINSMDLDVDLTYGRLFFVKAILISKNSFSCEGNINLLLEFPILNFNCILISPNKKNLYKRLNIDQKIKKEPFELNVSGNLNILNNKINFDFIEINKKFLSSEEDLKYYKKTFQDILFDKDFLDIFNLSKIKKFIIEIS